MAGKLYYRDYELKKLASVLKIEDRFSFEMSGDPGGMTKAQFIAKLQEANPNCVHSSLTKTTKYLFVDSLSSNTSKMNKARKYNVEIMTYEEALKQKF